MAAKRNTVNRVLSGIQPTGVPTLGNYLGALKTWVKLQDFFPENAEKSNDKATVNNRVLYMLADMHSLTSLRNPRDVQNGVIGLAATMLASGVDPSKSSIFQQSMVPGHAELGWLLQCHTPMGWLNRMTQFKEKSKARETPELGLYAYPALMAADILLYDATHVPVGDDQTQHLEFTRDIAARMNDLYGEDLFQQPKPIFPCNGGARIMSLRDGRKKMSKSDPSDYSRINMNDSPDEIRKKIRKAKTDSFGPVAENTLDIRPELKNMLSIMASLQQVKIEDLALAYDGKPVQTLKEDLAEVLVEKICPIGDEINRLMQDPVYLSGVLQSGAEVANETAQTVLDRTRKAVGLDILHSLPDSRASANSSSCP